MTAGWALAVAAVCVAGLLAWSRPSSPPTTAPPSTAPPFSLVITLGSPPGRLERFGAAYAASDLGSTVPLERLEAVDGRSMRDFGGLVEGGAAARLEALARTGTREEHRDLTPGAVGCYLSHLRAWRRVAGSGAPYAFVFEDDADIPRDTLARFHQALAQVGDRPWDVLLLGCDGEGESAGPNLTRMTRFLRLHAYAITPAAARRLCGEVLPIRQQVDWELSQRAGAGRLEVYAVKPSVVGVTWQGSTVQVPLQEGRRNQGAAGGGRYLFP